MRLQNNQSILNILKAADFNLLSLNTREMDVIVQATGESRTLFTKAAMMEMLALDKMITQDFSFDKWIANITDSEGEFVAKETTKIYYGDLC